jgi:acylphosphatase
MTRSAARLLVEGRVQGVGYRWWTVQAARALGLSGWVRNRRDGSVEILAIGDEDAIGQLAQACRTGPPAAEVRSVERRAGADDGSADFAPRETP